jgi:hypothetical protein
LGRLAQDFASAGTTALLAGEACTEWALYLSRPFLRPMTFYILLTHPFVAPQETEGHWPLHAPPPTSPVRLTQWLAAIHQLWEVAQQGNNINIWLRDRPGLTIKPLVLYHGQLIANEWCAALLPATDSVNPLRFCVRGEEEWDYLVDHLFRRLQHHELLPGERLLWNSQAAPSDRRWLDEWTAIIVSALQKDPALFPSARETSP